MEVYSQNSELSLKKNPRKGMLVSKGQANLIHSKNQTYLTMITIHINSSSNIKLAVMQIKQSKLTFSENRNKKSNYKQSRMPGITSIIKRKKAHKLILTIFYLQMGTKKIYRLSIKKLKTNSQPLLKIVDLIFLEIVPSKLIQLSKMESPRSSKVA